MDWCRANQVAVPDALATQIHRYRSAAQVGISQTTAR
jgi:hypothetical protein